jgi:hypothetical protein
MFNSTGPCTKFCEAFLGVIYVNAIKKFTNNVINLAKKSCSGFGIECDFTCLELPQAKGEGGRFQFETV